MEIKRQPCKATPINLSIARKLLESRKLSGKERMMHPLTKTVQFSSRWSENASTWGFSKRLPECSQKAEGFYFHDEKVPPEELLLDLIKQFSKMIVL